MLNGEGISTDLGANATIEHKVLCNERPISAPFVSGEQARYGRGSRDRLLCSFCMTGEFKTL